MLNSISKMVLGAAAVMAMAGTAHAKATPECLQGTGSQGYQTGFNSQYGVVMNLWTGVFNSEGYELEAFIEAVDIPYISVYSPSAYLRCRDQGLIEGASSALSAIAQSVSDAGVQNGELVGLRNGRIFCGVVAQQQHYGTVAKSIPLLTTVAEQSCKAAFLGYVNQNCSDKRVLDPYFNQNVDLACNFQ